MPPRKRLSKDSGRTAAKERPAVPSCQGKAGAAHKPVKMVYKPEENRWRCPWVGCKMFAVHEAQVEEGKPFVGTGQIEVLVVHDRNGPKSGTILLRATDNNIMLDITDYVTKGPEQNGRLVTMRLDFDHMMETGK